MRFRNNFLSGRLCLLCAAFLFCRLPLYADTLKVCYDASFIFKVGESCISYRISGADRLNVYSSQHTTGLIDIAHPLEQQVSADILLNPLSSGYLFFYEKNEHKSMTHHYYYKENLVYTGNSFRFRDSRYRSSRREFDKSGVLDPAAAVLFIQLNTLREGQGELRSFFEGKYVDITYENKGYDEIDFEGEKHRCRVVDFKVPVSTSSLITPTGVWRIFVDDETGIIMRLELKFPLGHAKLVPVSITGDRGIFRSYIN